MILRQIVLLQDAPVNKAVDLTPWTYYGWVRECELAIHAKRTSPNDQLLGQMCFIIPHNGNPYQWTSPIIQPFTKSDIASRIVGGKDFGPLFTSLDTVDSVRTISKVFSRMSLRLIPTGSPLVTVTMHLKGQ
ncbi:MAG: hypothetical protein EBZ48_16730 [Proteobacteria bacterium]|nr:hypothetical protein [Pseudomonadota bacterium]